MAIVTLPKIRHLTQILLTLSCIFSLSPLVAVDVGLIKVQGTIGPATVSYISRAIDQASEEKLACLIIELDTPGGALESTKEIVQKFFSSKIPTVVYVYPEGGWAGSAGCFIALAADVAAMAPGTSIGAAHPVAIGGGGENGSNDIMKQKLENFVSSYIASIAEKRGHNVEWAKSSVITSQAITATQALELKVINLIAKDLPDLLHQLNGMKIQGQILETKDAKVIEIPTTMREKLLGTLFHPELMFLFMLVAMYGLIGELTNPGVILPGVVGSIALIIVLFMATILPINLTGVALILLSGVLFIIDVYATTHGILTVGALVSFFLGALMLFDQSNPSFQLSLSYILPATLFTALFFFTILAAGWQAQLLPPHLGQESFLGKSAKVLSPIDSVHGKLFIDGEYWNAISEEPVAAGELVEIIALQGLTLKVRPLQKGRNMENLS